MNTATELSRPGLSPTVPMPRIRAEPLASLPVEETSSEGASWFSCRMSVAPEFCSDCAVTADTAIGTLDSGLARRVAVMMISPRLTSLSSGVGAAVPVSACTAPAAVGLSTGVVGVCPAASPLPALSCAHAGEATAAARQVDSSHMDLDINSPGFVLPGE
jgi:hypothetical protein